MAERLKKAEAVIITDYRGLNVSDITALRAKLREDNSEFQVIKNTLATRAFDAAGLEIPEDLLIGPTAVVLLHEDLAGPAKTLKQYVKDTQVLEIKGGMMGGQRLAVDAVVALADLPTTDQLRSMFLGVLQAPMRNFVTVTSAPIRDLLNVINAYAQGGEEDAA
jgi:large subunit ribosomal protein L10